MKQIPLTQGKFAIVDDSDYEWLNQWKWYAVNNRGKWYAARMNSTSRKIGRHINFIHNEIMKPPMGIEIDHQDGDGLNNQRYNLRNSTHAQNSANRAKRSDNTSGYKGVVKYWNRWKAQLFKDGRYVFIKTFATAEEAARAYDKAAREHFGEFANTNFKE